MEGPLARHLAVILSHSTLDSTWKAELRLVSRHFRREVDAHLRSLHFNFRVPSELDFGRFPQLRVITIARAPMTTALPVLQACAALTDLQCIPSQLDASDLVSFPQIQRLSVMRNGGGAPPPTAEVLSRCNLVSYKLEFEHQASLCQTLCDKLKALDLEGHEQASITTADLKIICSSKKLTVLRLSHCLEGVVKPLTEIARLGGQLRELDLSFNLRSLDFAAELVALNALTNLVKLNLSFSRLGSAALAGLTALSGLRDLRASACQMHSTHMAHLATAFPMLTYLDVSGSWELTEFSKQLGPKAFPQLRSLQLNYSTNMVYLTPLVAVRELNLAGTTPSEGILSAVEAMTALESLDLSNYSPHNTLGHLELAFLTKLQALSCVMLGGASRFGDEGIVILTGLRELSELELSGCGVTAAGVNALSALGKLTSLRVAKCPKLTASEIGTAVGRAVYAGHRHQGMQGAAHLGLLPN